VRAVALLEAGMMERLQPWLGSSAVSRDALGASCLTPAINIGSPTDPPVIRVGRSLIWYQ
jgi:hypothetical protein